MKKYLLGALAAFALSFGASAATVISQWDFNSTPSDSAASTGTLVPSTGSGTFSLLGYLTEVYNAPGVPPAGSSDPLGSDLNNSGLRLLGFWPASTSTASNKTAGVQMFISTVGWQNITLAWDQANSGSASKYYRVQYSVDNGANWVDKDVVTNATAATAWINPIKVISFAAVTGANNNTNFGVRIVSEFESTAIGSGTVGYVGVLNAYNVNNANLRLDMVTFSGDAASGDVNILADPTDVSVAIGQPASFTVSAGGGTTPITYQWRKAGSPILNATNSVLSFPSVQLTNAGGYDVIVANGVNSRTSAVATLTVRIPLNLAWTGQSGADWNTNTPSWVDTGSNAVPFTDGDFALFDSRGAAASTVSLFGSLNPNLVTVNSDTDFTFRTDTGGKLAGAGGLTKQGIGTLFVDTDNTYSGPTLIQAGVVQLGLVDAHGSLGSGPITNNAGLVVNRTGNFTLSNALNGNGSLTNLGTGTLTLGNVNNYTGRLSANAGILSLSGNQTINASEIYVTASTAAGAGGATKFALGGSGLVVGSGTTIHFTGLNGPADYRATFQSQAGTNIINGPTILEGTGSGAFETAGVGTVLTINGNVSGPSFSGALFLRGANGSGIVNGTINLPGLAVLKPDTSIWTINSTNNAWSATTIAGGGFRLGAHNALPTVTGVSFSVQTLSAFLDLAGFNQQIASLGDVSPATRFITNSSASSDSTLTVGFGNFGGSIVDSSSGRKTGLTINNGTFTLSGFNPYSGDSTVAAGTLALSGAGEIPNSAIINLAGGGLDVSAKNDGTLTLSATQTLKGNGTLAVTGNLANNGIIELKVNKAGNAVSNDKVAVSGNILFGGTLRLVLSGQAMTPGDTIPVVTAGAFSGGSFVIEPAVPASGLAWDTTTLATDGILRVAGTGTPSVTTTYKSGNNIVFAGSGGPANATYYVLSSTNVAAPVGTWTRVQTNQFDATGNFGTTNAILPGVPNNFYRLQVVP